MMKSQFGSMLMISTVAFSLCFGGTSTFGQTPGAPSAGTDLKTALLNIQKVSGKIKRTTEEVVNDVSQRKMADDTGDPLFFMPTEAQAEKDTKLWSAESANVGAVEAPRKSWLDADMSHLTCWINALNEAMNQVPADKQAAGGQSWQQLQAVVQDINDHMTRLKKLTAGPEYNNMDIAKATLSIHEDLKKLETPWKAALKGSK
jgi:hypothetical protein